MASRVQIIITLDQRDAERGVREVNSALDRLGVKARAATTEATSGFNRMERQGIMSAVLAAGLLERALASVGTTALRVAKESALLAAQNQTLTVAMNVVARNTGTSIQVLERQEDALRSLGLTTQATRRALARFTATELPVGRIQELADTARNLAVVMGGNTSEAFERLTRAITNQEVEILRTAGLNVNFEDGLRRTAAQLGKNIEQLTLAERNLANFNTVVEQNTRLQGIYEESLGTTGKQLTSLPRLFENVGEAIGLKFQTPLDRAITTLSEFLKLADRALRSDAVIDAARREFEQRRGLRGGDRAQLGVGLDAGTLAIETIFNSQGAARSAALADELFAEILRQRTAGLGARSRDFAVPQAGEGLGLPIAAQEAIEKANAAIGRQEQERLDRQQKITKAIEEQAKLLQVVERINFSAQIDQADEVTQVVLRTGETIERLQEIRRKEPELATQVQEAITNVQAAGSKEILEIIERQHQEELVIAQRAAAERQKLIDDEEKARRAAAERRIQDQQRVEEVVTALERSAALANLDAIERIEFERREAIARIEGEVNASAEQVERARVAINAAANERIRDENERIAEEQLRNFDRQAQEYDRLLDRMVRFTEQTGSLIGNIWRTLREEFQRSITKMVLSWLFGMNDIRRSTAATVGASGGGGGFGGLFGTLGGLIGLGGGVATPGPTPPFVNNIFEPSAAARAGGVGGAAAGRIPGATSPTAGGGSILDLLANGPLSGLFRAAGPFSQRSLLGLFLGLQVGLSGRPFAGLAAGLGGAIGGIGLAGGLAGIAGGGGFFGGAGAAIAGFLTNPVGLAILGGIGAASFLGGIFSRGGKKEKATAIANSGFEQMDLITRAFELRQTTFLAAVDRMQGIWEQMVRQWEQIGGSVGRNSIATQRPYFDEKLRYLERIQEERNRRQDLIDRLPIPEFATGGFVTGHGQHPILAALHAGEFVLNRRAVESIGRPQLEGMNRGSGSGGETFNVNIHAVDAASFEDFARRNMPTLQRVVVSAVRKDVGEHGGVGKLVRR